MAKRNYGKGGFRPDSALTEEQRAAFIAYLTRKRNSLVDVVKDLKLAERIDGGQWATPTRVYYDHARKYLDHLLHNLRRGQKDKTLAEKCE